MKIPEFLPPGSRCSFGPIPIFLDYTRIVISRFIESINIVKFQKELKKRS